MGKIKVLPAEVVEKIAAGEVVERPASVVKELVENSLDAGATRIEVRLERAGLGLIAVRDNGEGMTAEDAALALTRHATSKIRTATDLAAVVSFGFRGEALPSIAAVSHLELVSAVRGAVAGVKVACTGGGGPEVTSCAAAPGTLVEVRQLFFNTPARYKFLKSEATELKHIVEVLTRLAVVRPDVSFQAAHEGRELFTTSGSGDRREVLGLVLGRGEDARWLPLEADNRLFHVRGWLAPPELARTSRQQQIIIINGRWVKSPVLALAVEGGYGPFLVNSRRPVFCLEISSEPALVDVNVHPAKLEVRLSHEQELKALVGQAVRQALRRHAVLPAASSRMPAPALGDNKEDFRQPAAWVVKERAIAYPREEPAGSPRTFAFPAADPVGKGLPAPGGPAEGAPTEVEGCGSFPALTLLGQILDTYLVASGPEGLYLIDQHAAHERILFEQLLAEAERGTVAVQQLAVPQTITVTEPELAVWREGSDTWRRIGFDLAEFGADTLVLRAAPKVLTLGAAVRLVQDLLEQPPAGEQGAWERERHRLLSLLACHGAIRAGRPLSLAEGKELLAQLARCRHPYNCPHGRPTCLCLTKRELDKRFLRLLA
ncbi:DNA mismatch repair endonuclease MutL [Gelria sp. Kuro-4]|uniref:DNA mismatch repair endonuclease MutL n=1 Tax=Gelria sp. Kuro-4 TaxID=2796927 RepID=UPI001BEFBCC5|nr:DNA mismatch repair endonuclease MutL [Gelria sp. Kuro-4]BCV25035.1 DNA mismatch repair protein MutL [Gelria sp. Kuro-4]